MLYDLEDYKFVQDSFIIKNPGVYLNNKGGSK